MTSRLGRVNYYTINLNLAQNVGALVGGPTIGANGIIGVNGVTDSNVDHPDKSIWFGKSVKLSADGQTVAIGGYCIDTGKGYPVYVYDLKDYATNSQQGNFNVDYKKGDFPLARASNDPSSAANVLGERVLWLSPDGNTIAVGFPRSRKRQQQPRSGQCIHIQHYEWDVVIRAIPLWLAKRRTVWFVTRTEC